MRDLAGQTLCDHTRALTSHGRVSVSRLTAHCCEWQPPLDGTCVASARPPISPNKEYVPEANKHGLFCFTHFEHGPINPFVGPQSMTKKREFLNGELASSFFK